MAISFASLVRSEAVRYDTTTVSYGRAGRATNLEATEAVAVERRTMDRADLEQQLEKLHPASFAWALGCCRRDRSDAEEVLQDTYLKILEGKARFEGRSSLKTWLFSVIRRTAAAHRRLRWFRGLRIADGCDMGSVADGEESAEQRVMHSERSSALLRAIGRLARRQREVIELVFYHDMTVEQAADVVGVSLGTARVHYQRGKLRLLRELKREEMR
jgi:RNA polymerase sigma-70 factor, ECF subfamily